MMTPEGLARLDEYRRSALDPSLPWGGRSPRVLTRAYERFTLRERAVRLDDYWLPDIETDEQARRFLQALSP